MGLICLGSILSCSKPRENGRKQQKHGSSVPKSSALGLSWQLRWDSGMDKDKEWAVAWAVHDSSGHFICLVLIMVRGKCCCGCGVYSMDLQR